MPIQADYPMSYGMAMKYLRQTPSILPCTKSSLPLPV